MRKVAGVWLTDNVVRTLEQTVLSVEHAVAEDLELLRSGERSVEETLAYCLDGVEDKDTEQAWRAYVAALATVAQVAQ